VPAAARREAVSILASACSAKGSYLVIAHAAADIAPWSPTAPSPANPEHPRLITRVRLNHHDKSV
jgi:hypothetical protein